MATSVVPPSTSTIMWPPGASMGRRAPTAAAIGLDQVHLAGARFPRRVPHGAFLDLRDLGCDGEHDAWMDQALPVVNLPDEVVTEQ
jgi:hypothetical protein